METKTILLTTDTEIMKISEFAKFHGRLPEVAIEFMPNHYDCVDINFTEMPEGRR